MLIRQPCPRLPNPRPYWAKILHLLLFLALPAVILSGCTGVVSNVRIQPPPIDPVVPAAAPSIATNPASQTVTAGNTGVFAVAAAGAAPLSYQWQKNGVVIPGATFPTYVTPPTHSSDDGSIFVVVVSNSAGTLMSSPAMLTVAAGAPNLTPNASTLSFGNVVVGASSTMTVTFTNSGTAPATIASVSISPQAFTSPSALNGSAIAPGQSSTLSVAFAPPSATAFSGTITVISDAASAPLSIPISGTGVATPSHSVELSWTLSASSSIVGYIVERADQAGGPYTQLTPTPTSSPTYTDTSVRAGQTYFYIIIAISSTGQTSPPSNEAAVTIPTP